MTNSPTSFMSFMLACPIWFMESTLHSKVALFFCRLTISTQSGPNNGHAEWKGLTICDGLEGAPKKKRSHEDFCFLWFSRQWNWFLSDLVSVQVSSLKCFNIVVVVISCVRSHGCRVSPWPKTITACVKQFFSLSPASARLSADLIQLARCFEIRTSSVCLINMHRRAAIWIVLNDSSSKVPIEVIKIYPLLYRVSSHHKLI